MSAHLKRRLALRLLLHAKLVSPCSSFTGPRLHTTASGARCLRTHSAHSTLNTRAHAHHATSNLYGLQYSTTTSAADSHVEKGTLDEQLQAHFLRTRPSQDELDARKEALAKFQQAIDDYGKQRGFLQLPHAVKPVGSVACGLDRAGADLLLTIADPRMPSGWEPTNKNSEAEEGLHPPYSVGIAAKFLKELEFANVFANNPPDRIASVRATAPTDPPIICELALNAEAIYASQLIKTYVSLNRNIAPMVAFLQSWFESHNLYKLTRIRNNGRVDVLRFPFSEYTISLLVIAYLQVMRMLPNLQGPFVPLAQRVSEEDIASRISAPVVDKLLAQASSRPETFISSGDDVGNPRIWWYMPTKNEKWRVPMDVRFLSFTSEPVQDWLRARELLQLRPGFRETSLSELLQGFFQFWAQFPFHEWAVSVRDGGAVWRGRSSDDRDVVQHLDNAKLRTDQRLLSDHYLVRRDAPIHWLKFQKAIKWMLRRTPDLSTTMDFPVAVVDPLTGSYVRNTTRNTRLEDMEKFMQVCAAADDAIDAGAGVHDLLEQAVEVIYAEKTPTLKQTRKAREEEAANSRHLVQEGEGEDSWHLYLRGADIPDSMPSGGVVQTPSIVGRMRAKLAERRSVVEHSLRITSRVARKERKAESASDSTRSSR